MKKRVPCSNWYITPPSTPMVEELSLSLLLSIFSLFKNCICDVQSFLVSGFHHLYAYAHTHITTYIDKLWTRRAKMCIIWLDQRDPSPFLSKIRKILGFPNSDLHSHSSSIFWPFWHCVDGLICRIEFKIISSYWMGRLVLGNWLLLSFLCFICLLVLRIRNVASELLYLLGLVRFRL